MEELLVEKDVIELKNQDYKHKNIIYEMRTKQWLKLQELAELINAECARLGKTRNYTKVSIYQWESGERTPQDKTTLQAISNVLYIPFSKLVSELRNQRN